MREIVLRPGESITIGDTVIKAIDLRPDLHIIDSIPMSDIHRRMVAAGFGSMSPRTGFFIDEEGGDAA